MKKTKSESVYFFWSASILLCMLLACFTLIFASCAKGSSPKPEDSEAPSQQQSVVPVAPGGETAQPSGDPADSQPSGDPANTQTPGVTSATGEASAVLAETEDAGQEYVDKFVFLGDSTTYGLAHYDIVNDNQVWTPKSGTLTLNRWSIDAIQYPDEGTEISIVDAVTKKQPAYMMITLGVNGVSFMDEANFTTEYTNLVKAIQEASPNTKIILNSIYPINPNYKYYKDINNEKVDAANIWVQNIAAATGVKYLNSCSVLKDSNGALPDNAHNGDGIHLNPDSFKLVMNYLRTHAYL